MYLFSTSQRLNALVYFITYYDLHIGNELQVKSHLLPIQFCKLKIWNVETAKQMAVCNINVARKWKLHWLNAMEVIQMCNWHLKQVCIIKWKVCKQWNEQNKVHFRNSLVELQIGKNQWFKLWFCTKAGETPNEQCKHFLNDQIHLHIP